MGSKPVAYPLILLLAWMKLITDPLALDLPGQALNGKQARSPLTLRIIFKRIIFEFLCAPSILKQSSYPQASSLQAMEAHQARSPLILTNIFLLCVPHPFLTNLHLRRLGWLRRTGCRHQLRRHQLCRHQLRRHQLRRRRSGSGSKNVVSACCEQLLLMLMC